MSQFPQKPMKPLATNPAIPPASSGKAIASLVLGLVSMCALFFTGIPAIVLGFMALADIKSSQGRLTGQAPAIIGLVLGFFSLLSTMCVGLILPAMLLPAVQQAREAARTNVAMTDLKRIALATRNYHDANKRYPMAGDESDSSLAAKGGQLSWRVHLLPFLGESSLYEQFKLDEPWDSPHNMALINRMPSVYESPASGGSRGKTSYLAVVPPANAGPNQSTVFMKNRKQRIQNIMDGSSNTIMMIDAGPDNAVEWTRPADFEIDLDSPKRGLEGPFALDLKVVFADGSVKEISNHISDEDFLALLLANDGKIVNY